MKVHQPLYVFLFTKTTETCSSICVFRATQLNSCGLLLCNIFPKPSRAASTVPAYAGALLVTAEASMDEVMKYRGLSEYLKLAEGTLRHWVMAGKIPCFKMGRNVRFSKKEIDEWLKKQRRELRKAQTASDIENGSTDSGLFPLSGGDA